MPAVAMRMATAQSNVMSTAASTCSPRRILVVEDEPDMSQLLCLHLAGLPAEVQAQADGLAGLHAAQRQGPWDMIVLDLRLPGLDGLDLCRALRQSGDRVPILMLTARGSEFDRVLGLELGADDYLTKPFSVLELAARVRALWRRADDRAVPQGDDQPASLYRGPLQMNRLQRRVWLRGDEVVLTGREFELLWCFASEPGRAFSRDELLDRVWDTHHDGYEHTVNTHINRLRNKIGAGFIHTVWGRGYRFELPQPVLP
jgi:DNA-binding response OmpR family regulator